MVPNGHTPEKRRLNMLASKQWWEAAGIRALKTLAQTAVAMIGASLVLTDVNWATVGSAAVLAAVLSLLTSLAGLPEVNKE